MRSVAIPGLGLGPESWRRALGALGADPAAVHLLPGFGVPTEPGGAPPPQELAAELCSRLSGPTTLFGHSASCQVVAHAARLCPELVHQVVLVAPTTDPRAASWPGLVGLWLRTAPHEDPRQLPQLLRQYRRTTLRSMLVTMDAARHDDLLDTLSVVTCPVVLVRGIHDRIARADWVRALADRLPASRTVEVPVGAHLVPMTHPQAFADQVGPALA
jgi:pimeloyl-ACP methyl ester carboxylesterase